MANFKDFFQSPPPNQIFLTRKADYLLKGETGHLFYLALKMYKNVLVISCIPYTEWIHRSGLVQGRRT